ncbi:MAG: hypothetical protein NC548_38140 [Lachnospiraceae bacterium]|nr:hypothetical protein [Lachnospiraceae bacterium]
MNEKDLSGGVNMSTRKNFVAVSLAKETVQKLMAAKDLYQPLPGEGKVSISFFVEKLLENWGKNELKIDEN